MLFLVSAPVRCPKVIEASPFGAYAQTPMPKLLCPNFYAQTPMPKLLCPNSYAQTPMPKLLCPNFYAQTSMPKLSLPFWCCYVTRSTYLCVC
jgi:hypothetical protein